jgi:hypothetical protein
LIEIGLLVLEKIFFKFQCTFTLLLLPPIPFHLNNLEFPPLRMIYAKSGQNWSSGFGEEVENVKVYRQTDNRRSEKLT